MEELAGREEKEQLNTQEESAKPTPHAPQSDPEEELSVEQDSENDDQVDVDKEQPDQQATVEGDESGTNTPGTSDISKETDESKSTVTNEQESEKSSKPTDGEVDINNEGETGHVGIAVASDMETDEREAAAAVEEQEVEKPAELGDEEAGIADEVKNGLEEAVFDEDRLNDIKEEFQIFRTQLAPPTSALIDQLRSEEEEETELCTELEKEYHISDSAGEIVKAKHYRRQYAEAKKRLNEIQAKLIEVMNTETQIEQAFSAYAATLDEDMTIVKWFEGLEPRPKMLSILLCLFEEVSWDNLSEIFEFIIESFGHDRFLSREEQAKAEKAGECPLKSLDSVFDARFSELTKVIRASRRLDSITKCVMIAYPKEPMAELFDYVKEEYFDILLQIATKIIEFGGSQSTPLATRWACAYTIGRVLNVGAKYLLRHLVSSWVFVDDKRSDSNSVRAALGYTLRYALEVGAADADDIQTWFRELRNPGFRTLEEREKLKWMIASVCKEIGQYDAELAMEQLYHLYKPGESDYIRDAVQYSEYALVLTGKKHREVLLAASGWCSREIDWRKVELYLWNFVRLLDFYIRRAEVVTVEEDDVVTNDVDESLRRFLVRKDEEVDRAIAGAYRSIVTVIDFDLLMQIHQDREKHIDIFQFVLDEARGENWRRQHIEKEKLYRYAFSCLRNLVFKFGGDLIVRDRVQNILKEILSLVLEEVLEYTTEESLARDDRNVKAFAAILRVMRLLDEVTGIWQVGDINQLRESENEKEITHLKDIRQMLIGVFDENYWIYMEALLVRITQCEDESISSAAYEFVDKLVKWVEKFDILDREDHLTPRVVHVLASFVKKIDLEVTGLPRALLREKRVRFQKIFREWSKKDRNSTESRLAQLIFKVQKQ